MGSCLDLRKYQNPEAIQDIYSKIVSGGRMGYKAVVERKKEYPKCSQCPQDAQCPGCTAAIMEEKKFCGDCGHKLK